MAQLGDTEINGDLTVTGNLTNNGIDLHGRIENHMNKFVTMFGDIQNLTVTNTVWGENYNEGTVKVNLMGNRLQFYVYTTRKTATSAGNITNEEIVAVTIDHGGKIENILNNCGLSYQYGHVNSFNSSRILNSNTTCTLKLHLTATNAASTTFATCIPLTAVMNPNAY